MTAAETGDEEEARRLTWQPQNAVDEVNCMSKKGEAVAVEDRATHSSGEA